MLNIISYSAILLSEQSAQEDPFMRNTQHHEICFQTFDYNAALAVSLSIHILDLTWRSRPGTVDQGKYNEANQAVLHLSCGRSLIESPSYYIVYVCDKSQSLI